jgi:uncharacterized membrane protein
MGFLTGLAGIIVMEEHLRVAAEYVALFLEFVSVLVVAIGGLEATVRLLFPLLRGRMNQGHGVRRAAWLSLARWLLISLEFMLAADIVRSTIAPSWDDVGKLAAIAVIRTFLNYFLERDLEALSKSGEAPHGHA